MSIMDFALPSELLRQMTKAIIIEQIKTTDRFLMKISIWRSGPRAEKIEPLYVVFPTRRINGFLYPTVELSRVWSELSIFMGVVKESF